MRKFKSTDGMGNTDTIFVRPSDKKPGMLNINMANQHGVPMCLSNVVYCHAGYAEARRLLIDAVTTAWNENESITDALYEVTKQKWTEV